MPAVTRGAPTLSPGPRHLLPSPRGLSLSCCRLGEEGERTREKTRERTREKGVQQNVLWSRKVWFGEGPNFNKSKPGTVFTSVLVPLSLGNNTFFVFCRQKLSYMERRATHHCLHSCHGGCWPRPVGGECRRVSP